MSWQEGKCGMSGAGGGGRIMGAEAGVHNKLAEVCIFPNGL